MKGEVKLTDAGRQMLSRLVQGVAYSAYSTVARRLQMDGLAKAYGNQLRITPAGRQALDKHP